MLWHTAAQFSSVQFSSVVLICTCHYMRKSTQWRFDRHLFHAWWRSVVLPTLSFCWSRLNECAQAFPRGNGHAFIFLRRKNWWDFGDDPVSSRCQETTRNVTHCGVCQNIINEFRLGAYVLRKGIQLVSAWHGSSVPHWTVYACRCVSKSSWWASVLHNERSGHTTLQTVNLRHPCFQCRWSSLLERSARLSKVTRHFFRLF